MVLLPIAKEVMASYGNIPVLVDSLMAECEREVIGRFGFKQVDYSRLENDNLWYIK